MNCERLHQIDNDLSTDPNTTFHILNQALMEAKDKNFSEQVTRFYKYKHKLNKWITAGILKSLQYRHELYNDIQLLSPESAQYDMAKLNLKAYNNTLNRSIRIAKKTCYTNELNKYKNDIRKRWETLKTILNKAKIKWSFPKFFLINGKKVTDMRLVASNFSSYFINVGSETLDPIETSNKLPFSSYLGPRCQSALTFS